MTIEEQNHHASKVQTLLDQYPRKPRSTAQIVNLLNEDLRRVPGETLYQRRERINRQREARMVAKVELVADVNRDDLVEHDSNGMA